MYMYFLVSTDLALWQKSLEQLLPIQTWKQREGAVLSPCKGMVSLVLKGCIWFGYLAPIPSKANEEQRGCKRCSVIWRLLKPVNSRKPEESRAKGLRTD